MSFARTQRSDTAILPELRNVFGYVNSCNLSRKVENDRGNNFGQGRRIAPASAGARAGVDTMLCIVSRIHG